MGESKRVAFSTIDGDVNIKEKKSTKALRFDLSLTESNDKSYPEFDYGQLVTQHFNKRFKKSTSAISGPLLDPKDPFASVESDDAGLQELAKKFEKKYGTGVTKRKKKFKDLGEGYDDTDPFIDNSDMVADFVPTNKEAKYGGFYINSGTLDFKEVPKDDGSEDEIGEKRPYKKRKRCISDDEEENMEVDTPATKVTTNGVIPVKRKPKMDAGELLRHKKKMISKFNKSKSKHERKESKHSQGTKVNSSIAASIESVVTKAREAADLDVPIFNHDDLNSREMNIPSPGPLEPDESSSSSSSSASSSSSNSSSSSSSDSGSEDESPEPSKEEDPRRSPDLFQRDHMEDPNRIAPEDSENEVALPTNLPTDLIEVLDRIKEAGRFSKGSSQKFFSESSVNKMLLTIEIKLRSFGGRKKTQIYKHLAQHLPCGMQTLIKRGKNLLSEKLDEKLKQPLTHLASVVEQMMPKLIEKHKLECQRVAQSNESNQSSEDPQKRKNVPKRKYPFSLEAKNFLCEAVKIRCQGYNMIKKRNETIEEHVRAYLEEQVRPLWPKGWMSTKILFKESESAHRSFINGEVLPAEKKSTPASTPNSKPAGIKYTEQPSKPERSDVRPAEKKSVIVAPTTELDLKKTLPKLPASLDIQNLLQLHSDLNGAQKGLPKTEPRPMEKEQPRLDVDAKKPVQKKADEPLENQEEQLKGCRPPKPSLSATVLPKKESPDKSSIMVKTVDRINEGLHSRLEAKFPKVGRSEAMDLSTDKTPEKAPKKDPPQPTPTENPKLQQDIDDVMNDLLLISKQKLSQSPESTQNLNEVGTGRILNQIDKFEGSPSQEQKKIEVKLHNKPSYPVHSIAKPIVASPLTQTSTPTDSYPRQKKSIAASYSAENTPKYSTYTVNDSSSMKRPEKVSITVSHQTASNYVSSSCSHPTNTSYSISSFISSSAPNVSTSHVKPHKFSQSNKISIPTPANTQSISMKISPQISKNPTVISHSSKTSYSQSQKQPNLYTAKPSLIGACINDVINSQLSNSSRSFDGIPPQQPQASRPTTQTNHIIQKQPGSSKNPSATINVRNLPTSGSSIPGLPQVSLHPTVRTTTHQGHWKNEVIARTNASQPSASSASGASSQDPLSNLRMLHGMNVNSLSQPKNHMVDQRISTSSQNSSSSYGAPSNSREIPVSHPKLKQSRPENISMNHALLANLSQSDLRLLKEGQANKELWQQMNLTYGGTNSTNQHQYTSHGGNYTNHSSGNSKNNKY